MNRLIQKAFDYLQANWRYFLRFCIVGVTATGIHYGIYLLLRLWIPINIAYTIGYGISLCCNFVMTSRFTFAKAMSWQKGGGFVLSHAINYGLHMLFFNTFIWLGCGEIISPLLTIAIVVPINFTLIKFVFQRFK